MADLTQYSDRLVQSASGIWTTQASAAISYPAEGNDLCFEVEDSSFWFKHRNAVIVEAVRAHPPSGPLFDIGGGNGFVAAGLQAAGFDVVLVEPGEAGVLNARSRGLKTVVHSTLEAARFHANSLHAASLFDVLEHIEDDRSLLTSLHNSLVPSGRLYITVPAHRWLWSSADDYAGHYRRYTRRSLSAVLTDSGYEVEYSSYIFRALPLPILILRTLPWRLGLGSKDTKASIKRQLVNKGAVIDCLTKFLLAGEVRHIANRSRMRFGASLLTVVKRR